MMKAKFFLPFFFISLFTLQCSSPEVKETIKVTADKSLLVKVDGMVCAVGCAKYIEKQVASMEGVTSCYVNFSDGIAKVEYSSNSTNDGQILELIGGLSDGQYKVSVVEINSMPAKTGNGKTGSGKSADHGTESSIKLPELVTYFMSRIVR